MLYKLSKDPPRTLVLPIQATLNESNKMSRYVLVPEIGQSAMLRDPLLLMEAPPASLIYIIQEISPSNYELPTDPRRSVFPWKSSPTTTPHIIESTLPIIDEGGTGTISGVGLFNLPTDRPRFIVSLDLS